MRRVLVYDRFDAQICELAPADVFALESHEEINGEHSLTITTTFKLSQGNRILMQDDRGYWHEWVVYGIDQLHESGDRPIGTYYCTWSVQPDLMGTRISAMPGAQVSCPATDALTAVLGGTARWTKGTVTNTNTGGASMYDTDGWSAMSVMLETWGGEIVQKITVDGSGVVSRQIDYPLTQGDSTAKRRFDFGQDLNSVRRTYADGPLYCRITPRGKGDETDTGGYGRKITIEDVNGGLDYLENAAMVPYAKLPDGNGGYEYPTLEVENSDCETPAELKAWAQSVLDEYTTPQVSYEVDVIQAAREGVDLQGVSLGDVVQIVDRKFEGIELSGRVVEVTKDEITGSNSTLVISSIGKTLSDRFSNLSTSVKQLTDTVSIMNGGNLSTAEYLSRLLDRLNDEINATGGYTYIVPGHGILTYNVAVADPLNPTEASSVVEIKGGTIRIANSKTPQGVWEWKTVFVSGHVAAEVVTAANLVAGYIGNVSGNYWNLDTGELIMKSASGVTFDGTDMDEILIDNAHFEYYISSSPTTLADGSWSTTTPTYTAGSYIWQRLVTVREDGTTTYSDAVALTDEPSAFVRSYSSGVLVCRVGQSTGALVNASGYFDVVKVTWSDGVPTAGDTLARFSESQIWLGKNSTSSVIDLCNGSATMGITTNGAFWTDLFTIKSTHGVVCQWYGDGTTHQNSGQYSFVECFYTGYESSRKNGMIRIQCGDNVNSAIGAGLLITGRSYSGTTLDGPAMVSSNNQYVELYSNSSGTTGSVSLSWSIVEFNHINIYYRGNDGYENCTTISRVESSTDCYADLSVVESTTNGSLNIKSRRVKLSGKNITNMSYAEMDNGGAPSSTNNVKITRVEGWTDISIGG